MLYLTVCSACIWEAATELGKSLDATPAPTFTDPAPHHMLPAEYRDIINSERPGFAWEARKQREEDQDAVNSLLKGIDGVK